MRGIFAVAFVVVLARLVVLQVIRGSDLAHRAEQQRRKAVWLEGERGVIRDRQGLDLALNREAPSIYAASLSAPKNPRADAAGLASLLGVDASALEARLTSGRFVWLARRVSPAQATRVQALGLKRIGQVVGWERVYPQGSSLSHVLGFTGLDNSGLEGLELQYQAALAGPKSYMVQEQDGYGRPVFRTNFQYGPPARGKDLVLTIDAVIQHFAERELEQAVRAHHAVGGTVIVMAPRTGEVLAMTTWPTYDPNAVRHHQPAEWRNRAITDINEPGSTFKVVVAAAALEAGLVSPEELIDCEQGRAKFTGAVLHDHIPYGLLTFGEVIQKSSNIGMAKVGLRLGEQRFSREIKAFGFGARTGIDLPGESPGLFRETDRWSGRSLATLSIGQEVAVTPIQLITAVSAVANGGLLMRPYVVAEVRGPQGEVLERTVPKVRRRVISERTAGRLTRILQGVLAPGGTAEWAALDGYTAAGKTGTAQKLDPVSRAYARDRSVSYFVGYLTVEDPKAVILVVIDEPKGRGWGSTVAAPAFKRIAMQVAQYLRIPSTQEGRVLLVAQ